MSRFTAWGVVALLAYSAACGVGIRTRAAEAIDSADYWDAGRKAIAAIGDGFIVWESRRLVGVDGRKGEWSLWTISLDGTGLRQFAPDEPDRNQTSPHISPDGTRVVYLSFPAQGGEHMAAHGENVPLHIIGRDGTGDRILVPDARQYSGWDRAVTWFNDNELAYIGGDGSTYHLDLTSGESTLLIKKSHPQSPSWLPNTTRTHACWSFNTFSLYSEKTSSVTQMPHLGGCQPYFCQDGIWGFWEGGIGGPINKMHLATRAISPILGRGMMPPERNFVYFPMISDRNRLLAFAATDKVIGGYGGYTESDYDLFVVQLDPRTLDVVSEPVRYTFHPKCDRFPDVWQAEPALGFYSDEAPFNVAFASIEPMDGTWQWDFGDGVTEEEGGSRVQHTYAAKGVFTVVARQGARSLRGQVRVAEAKAPKALDAVLETPKEILVAFDEPVQLRDVKVEMGSGAAIVGCMAGEDQRSLRVSLRENLPMRDLLRIDGVTDLAQRPNRMAPSQFSLLPRLWPSNSEGLCFVWENAKARNIVHDPQTGEMSAYALPLRDRTWLDHNYALVFDGGNTCIPGFGDKFSNAVRQSGEYTLELTLTPRDMTGDRQCILSNGVAQSGDQLVHDGTPVCTLKPDVPNHVVIARTSGPDGKVVCYLDGRPAFSADRPGDLSGFRFQWVSIGNNLDGHTWLGGLEGIALYSRFLNAAEAKANAAAYRAIMAKRSPVDRVEVDAKLVAVSPSPSLSDIQPYSQALAVYEYEVLEVTAGDCPAGRIRVAHWVILDREPQRIAQTPPGGVTHLVLEPLEANPQLEEEYTRDSLEPDFEAPVYFALDEHRSLVGAAQWNVINLPTGAGRGLADPQEIEDTPRIITDYALKEGQKWSVAGPDASGRVDLYAGTGGRCGYALMYVRSPEARGARLSVGAVGGAYAWVNGVRVIAEKEVGRYPFFGFHREAVNLKKGWNEVLLKIDQKHAFMRFICDILSPADREMTDLAYALHP